MLYSSAAWQKSTGTAVECDIKKLGLFCRKGAPVAGDAVAQPVNAVTGDAALLHDCLRHLLVDGLQGRQRIALDLRDSIRGSALAQYKLESAAVMQRLDEMARPRKQAGHFWTRA